MHGFRCRRQYIPRADLLIIDTAYADANVIATKSIINFIFGLAVDGSDFDEDLTKMS